jgi:hypothetical protein
VQPEHLSFGGGVSETIVNPLVLLVAVIAGLLVCFSPRNRAVAAFLAAGLLIPMDHVLVLGGLHFPMLRILILFGIARMIRSKTTSQSEIFSGGMTRLDVTLVFFELVTAVNALLLWRNSGMLVKQLGDLFTVFGIYFLMRFLIRDGEDVEKALRVLAYITVVVATIMIYEQATGHNPYALLGGAKAAFYESDLSREDRLRAVAGFGHPILAGTFGAIVMPLFVGLWLKDKKNLQVALAGFVASTVVVWASASSTPLLAYAGALMALCIWPLRKLMRPIRWGIVLLLVSLHMAMKAPVWQLIDRMSIIGGSSGYHRYQLVDQCIRHFGDWWLYGVKDTGAWGWDMWDTANQYVSVADSTGLLPLILFVTLITYGFKFVVQSREAWAGNTKMQQYSWALGGALFANCVGFFGISYWDQTQLVWYAFLAIIVASYYSVPAAAEATATVLVPVEPVKAAMPRPAYASENSKTVNSYGRMVTGRLSSKLPTK